MVKVSLAVPVVARRVAGRRLLSLLVVLFFFSGISGLIYQVLWLRLLALVFGVTIYAASTVLASFMAGLALGSFLAGRLADRTRTPLRLFGYAEILVGLSALASPLVLEAVGHLYAAIYPALPLGLAPLTLVRFLGSFAVLIVPTTLMGATLPLVIKSSLLRAEGLGERAGLLYGVNTTGAIVGTLLAGFVLIGGLGIGASFRLAAAINALVGLTAILVAPAFDGEWGDAEEPADAVAQAAPVRAADSAALPERARRLVLIVFALSGFASLALEVLWFRILVLFFQVTTYAFTTMLATVLLGIALGSYLIAPLLRWRLNWLAILATIELALGIVALASLATLDRVYATHRWIEARLPSNPTGEAGQSLDAHVSVMLLASLLAIFPAALLLGIAFPIGLRLWAARDNAAGADSGRRVGIFYALNLCGAILGAIVAGFVLLPWLGSRGSVIVVAAINVGAGLLLLTAPPRPRRGFALGLGGGGVLLFLAVALVVPHPLSMALARRYTGERLLWHEEGLQMTVSVQQWPDGGRVFYLDGIHQADDSASTVGYHRLIGHLPLALHPDPREALVIGLGGGVTAGAVSRHAGVNVEVVELSGTVVRGSEWFRHVNDDVLHQPNVTLRVDDGRNYLLLTRRRYDVITADIIRPYHAGAGNLYSVEYFQLARDALNDDGLMLQWINPESEAQYRLIMRTFLSVFPDATLWADGSLLVGTKQPLQLDQAVFERKLREPATREGFAALGLGTFPALLATYTAGPEEMRRFVGDGPRLTDDRPQAEYFLSLPRDNGPVDLSGLRGDPLRHVRP